VLFALSEGDDEPYDDDKGDKGGLINSKIQIDEQYFFLDCLFICKTY